MKIIPLAFDSFGARSMATFVLTKDVRIIIDPSVALGPRRYGLPPHEKEIRRKEKLWEKIKKYAGRAEIVIITHYHYDHHNPHEVEVFRDKIVLIKDPKNKINRSQMGRSAFFLSQIKDVAKEITVADEREFEFGNVSIKFSKPVPHGTNDRLGYVLEVLVEEKRRFLFTSDVEGLSLEEQFKEAVKFDPDVVFADGPMTYMLNYRFSQKSLESSIRNLVRLMEETGVKKLVIDHHLTRDLKWRERMEVVFEKGEELGVKVLSAANFAGVKENLLEARRKELYES
ncbi:MBL fold metallo-hydrolase [Ferroglobus sp.]|uniref:MBL fold metallo-hydrolase n=1 Tax=Ferroglobus sp. TaxID=2614230 RepID=UPI0025C3D104|nr:MBL fold metallo-hydrolase [Ferroglobus sp.]